MTRHEQTTEQTYHIRCATVAFMNEGGWATSRQIPEFSVRATSEREAARIAVDVMTGAARDDAEARASFGMLDEADGYSGWTALGRVVVAD